MQIKEEQMSTYTIIVKMISEMFGIRRTAINKNTDLINDLALDLLDITELMVRLEKRFGIMFNSSQIKYIRTVGDIVSQVNIMRKSNGVLSVYEKLKIMAQQTKSSKTK